MSSNETGIWIDCKHESTTVKSFSLLQISRMRYEKFERRRIIIRKGHVGTSMYFICFGSVGVIHEADADALFSQVDPIILHRGKSFGEMALMTRCKRNATVCCMEPGIGIVLNIWFYISDLIYPKIYASGCKYCFRAQSFILYPSRNSKISFWFG